MTQKTRFSTLAAGTFGLSLLLSAIPVQAADVILDANNNVTRIDNLEVILDRGVTLYDVNFISATGISVYGSDYDFDFPIAEDAILALEAVTDALNANNPRPTGAGSLGTDQFFIGNDVDLDTLAIGAAGGAFAGGVWDQCNVDCILGVAIIFFDQVRTWADFVPAGSQPPPPTPPPASGVDVTGTVTDAGGTQLCSLVLASGQFDFSCNPNGPFSLLDLPTESDGSVTRQVYVDGFLPNVERLTGSSDETVVMTRAGTCTDYNAFPQPGVFPDSSGKRIDVSGTVLLQNTQTPVCAMVLGNGQFDFTCDGTGSYAGNIPLDANGQYKLQVYAQGFAPMIQAFDEFSPTNEVRLARAAECQ